jgi:proteasome lid subunit RPN8/RPN11
VVEVSEELFIIFMEHSAFRDIVTHTAQYAHFDLKVKNWKEVYGFLSGYIDEDTQWVHITNAYPITHGTHYGVEFKKRHYVRSAYLNLMIAEQNEFFVGWYHSHPGLDLFLSETDVMNHLAYQIVNPKAIAVVFDHTKIIQKSPPLMIFQLDNPQYGIQSSYHPVEYYIGGINKKDEIEKIRDLYYDIEAEVLDNKIPPIEKQVDTKVKQWRKRTKTKLPDKTVYKKKKLQKRGIKQSFPQLFEE